MTATDGSSEWIKGLLAVPFVLYSQPTGVFEAGQGRSNLEQMKESARKRYCEILRDVEVMVDDDIASQQDDRAAPSKLRLLVPGVGPFFTPLPLEAAFQYQDGRRNISSRRFVSPSFNDIRLILNSAQLMAVTQHGRLQLATFDGDVTLYDDGQSLEPSSPMVPRLLELLANNVKIGIVTAAGYTGADRYYERLHGLLDAMATTPALTAAQRQNMVVMGGESSYLFQFSATSPHRLEPVSRSRWLTPEMAGWDETAIASLLDVAEVALHECVRTLQMPATLTRKDRAVGIVPDPGAVIPRESLEETVLVVQKILELSPAGRARRVPFCAFNGGRDVFVDIGDKSWGVTVCQRWLADVDAGHPITSASTLHVGDQFLSAGANDFRARSVATTAWIANPAETVELLHELRRLHQRIGPA